MKVTLPYGEGTIEATVPRARGSMPVARQVAHELGDDPRDERRTPHRFLRRDPGISAGTPLAPPGPPMLEDGDDASV